MRLLEFKIMFSNIFTKDNGKILLKNNKYTKLEEKEYKLEQHIKITEDLLFKIFLMNYSINIVIQCL